MAESDTCEDVFAVAVRTESDDGEGAAAPELLPATGDVA